MQPGDLVGQMLGHYKIKKQIGYGGMSTVFLADDIHLGREVALKVFWPRPGETQDFLRRFIREARVLAQLDHPNILPVYDYGEQGEMAFLVVPYMAGGTLKEVLQKRKALPPSEAVQLLNQVLPALQYAHDRNLIHRDIKPGNLLFKSADNLVLADFGLVKVIEGEEREGVPLQTISDTGLNIAGTPEYMSPEQIDGHAVPASDIYSLGVVLYEMVTGVRPFLGTNLLSVLMKQANETARPPREFNPYVSPQLEATILKALAKDPSKRFARPADFQQALQQSGNPASSPGSATLPMQVNAGSNPAPLGGQTGNGAYGSTIATNWTQGPGPMHPNSQPGGLSNPNTPVNSSNQPPQIYSPGTPSAPTVPNSQPGLAPAQLPLQGPAPVQIQRPVSQPGLAPGNNSATPQPSFQPSQPGVQPLQPIQPWATFQTAMPSFVPQQPKRSRTPLVVLLILCVLLVGVVASLFMTPLGPMLFSRHALATQTPGSNPVTPGSGTQTGRGVRTNVPGGTQAMSATLTSCPAGNAARAAVTAPLTSGNDPTIVYIVDESDASGNPTYGTVKLFDTVSGKKSELLKSSQTNITEAQISDDGQWVLFSAIVAGQSELRMVRLDGQGLQTLLCAPAGMTIRYSQWSIDQRYVVFDEFPQNGEPTVYLLNTQSGALQIEVTPPASGAALVARTWLDNNRILMVGIIPNSDAPQENIYILNIGGGANQDTASIHPVFTSAQPCWDFDSSYDSQTLFIAQCIAGPPTGSSTIGKQPSTGGTLSPIMASSSLAFNTVRVIDPASTTLLALASNTSEGNTGSQQNDGLYTVKTDGSGSPLRLTSVPAQAVESLNTFSQYFWSNISRDHTMYALETVKANGASSQYTLAFGQLSGGAPNAFTDYNQYMAMAGWTTT
jgi:eukaryotic-like serine/threonine-protein kinase